MSFGKNDVLNFFNVKCINITYQKTGKTWTFVREPKGAVPKGVKKPDLYKNVLFLIFGATIRYWNWRYKEKWNFAENVRNMHFPKTRGLGEISLFWRCIKCVMSECSSPFFLPCATKCWTSSRTRLSTKRVSKQHENLSLNILHVNGLYLCTTDEIPGPNGYFIQIMDGFVQLLKNIVTLLFLNREWKKSNKSIFTLFHLLSHKPHFYSCSTFVFISHYTFKTVQTLVTAITHIFDIFITLNFFSSIRTFIRLWIE